GAGIATRPGQQRVTLAMAAAGDMNSAEIGAALGVPAGTVRYRLSLARRTLAEALGDYDDAQEEEQGASTTTSRPGPPPSGCRTPARPRSSGKLSPRPPS